MFYTKVIMQAPDNELLLQKFLTVTAKRWDLVPATTSGGTKAHRLTADAEWFQHACENYNSARSKAAQDALDLTEIPGFPEGTTYFEVVRVWESAAVAQEFVDMIQSLNLSGVTVSYEGTTDPSAV